jgi:TFIIF-interacting CTD phosphatase-like protein
MTHKLTVILDWDGTLAASIPEGIITRPVHAARALDINLVSLNVDPDGKPVKRLLILRPYFFELILTLSAQYNLAVWSFAVSAYIRRCIEATGLNAIIKESNLIAREDMLAVDTNYKDIYLFKTRLGIRMHEVVIVDDSNGKFGLLNPINCVDVPSWNPDMRADNCLRALPEMIEQRFKVLARHGEDSLVQRRADIMRSLG